MGQKRLPQRVGHCPYKKSYYKNMDSNKNTEGNKLMTKTTQLSREERDFEIDYKRQIRRIEQIADSNFCAAQDEIQCGEDASDRLASYAQNAADTADEQGLNGSDAWGAFCDLAAKHYPNIEF